MSQSVSELQKNLQHLSAARIHDVACIDANVRENRVPLSTVIEERARWSQLNAYASAFAIKTQGSMPSELAWSATSRIPTSTAVHPVDNTDFDQELFQTACAINASSDK